MINYNKTLFDRAGVAYPQPGWTWDDFLAKAQALTRKDKDGKQLYGVSVSTSINHWQFWVYLNGGSIVTEKGEYEGALDSPKTIEALRFWSDLYLKHKVAPSIDAMTAAGGGGWRAVFLGVGPPGCQRQVNQQPLNLGRTEVLQRLAAQARLKDTKGR